MYKILLLGMNYIYETCNPQILKLSMNKKDKFRIIALQAQIIYIRHFGFVICMCIFC